MRIDKVIKDNKNRGLEKISTSYDLTTEAKILALLKQLIEMAPLGVSRRKLTHCSLMGDSIGHTKQIFGLVRLLIFQDILDVPLFQFLLTTRQHKDLAIFHFLLLCPNLKDGLCFLLLRSHFQFINTVFFFSYKRKRRKQKTKKARKKAQADIFLSKKIPLQLIIESQRHKGSFQLEKYLHKGKKIGQIQEKF